MVQQNDNFKIIRYVADLRRDFEVYVQPLTYEYIACYIDWPTKHHLVSFYHTTHMGWEHLEIPQIYHWHDSNYIPRRTESKNLTGSEEYARIQW